MINEMTDEEVKNKFKKVYKEEFEDVNESFMDFLFDLIPVEILNEVLEKGNRYYYKILKKYK